MGGGAAAAGSVRPARPDAARPGHRRRPVRRPGGRAVHHRRAGCGARRPAAAAGSRPLSGRARRVGLDARHRPDLPPAARRVLAGRLRLARAGAHAERIPAVHDERRRAGRTLHPSPFAGAGRAAAHADPRLARHLLRVLEDGRPARRSGQPRRQRRGRLPCGRPVAARLRVLGAAAPDGALAAADGPDVHGGDGAAGLRPLRRAGRRRRRQRGAQHGRVRRRPRGGAAPQQLRRRAARPGEPARRPDGRGDRAAARAARVLQRRGAGLSAHPGDAAADARLRTERFARGSGRLDRPRSTAPGATAAAIRRRSSRRTSC